MRVSESDKFMFISFEESLNLDVMSIKLMKSLDFHSTKSMEHQSEESKSELEF